MNIKQSVIRLSLQADKHSAGIDFLYTSLKNDISDLNIEGSIIVSRYLNKLEIAIYIKQNEFIADLLQLAEILYVKILSPFYGILNSVYRDEVYSCSLEVPIYFNKSNQFPLNEIIKMGYQYKLIPSYLKSNTYHLIRIIRKDSLNVFVNNSYNMLLASIGISLPHDVRQRMATMELIKHKVQQVTDLGCGKGSFIFNLSRANPDVNFAGIDSDKDKIDYALKMKQEHFQNSKIGFTNSDILHLNKNKTQAITLIEVIEHINIEDLRGFFSNIFDKLDPELLIITTPNCAYNIYLHMNSKPFRHDDHRFELSHEGFTELISNVVKDSGYSGAILPIGFIKENGSSISQIAIITK